MIRKIEIKKKITVRSGFAFYFFGWRVTEVHTNGMKFTDKREKSIQLSQALLQYVHLYRSALLLTSVEMLWGS